MSKYHYSIAPVHLRKDAKHYTTIDNRLIALHLSEGSESLTTPGTQDNPPVKKTAFAPTQKDLEFLFNSNHPFAIRTEITETEKPKAEKIKE